jgi:zona occludens toxin
MINGISGRPGAGKTYEVVTQHIIPALTQKRKIITNIPLNVDWLCRVVGEHCRDLIVLIDGGYHNYGESRFFSKAEHFLEHDSWRNENNQGVYFFIDECHLAMPVGATDKSLKEYLSMHRHYGHDLMLLTQNFRKVDRDVKDMIQTCYFCTKLSFLAKDHAYVCKVADGVSRNIVHVHQREYEKKFFGAYQSHTKSTGSVIEAQTTGVKKWYQRWTTIGAATLCAFAVFILIGAFSKDTGKAERQALETLENLKKGNQTQQPNPFEPVVTQQQPNSTQLSKPVEQFQQPKEPDEPKSPRHPFEGINVHLSGYHADYDKRGRFNKVYYFALSRNGQYLSEITNVDMQLAGYTVKIFNPCVAEISYGKFEAFVLCDTPTTDVTLAGESLTASVD